MFYAASKVLTFLLQPSTFCVLLVIAGLILMRWDRLRRRGRVLAWLGALGLFAAGVLPLGNLMVLPLEQRYAGVGDPARDGPVTGIIMLGGFEDDWVSKGRGGVTLNEAAERLTEGVRLALKHRDAKVVFTGGVGGLLSGGTDATAPIGQLLQDWGVAPERIVLEGKSRNTHENAEFTRALVDPKPGERWVLVTSAYHMPRAMGVFRHAGFAVVPHPVDFRTHGPIDALRLFERIGAGLERTDLAFKEWVGLLVYRLTGRTDELFPAPV
jgi:uncharacterized SAM-binding protein YcdF (DUF218 family)